MTNLTHLFHIGQQVKCRFEAYAKIEWHNGVVTETYPDHIIVYLEDLDIRCWYEEGFNIGDVYPIYNEVRQ